jgi:hypothetical protein
MSKVRKSDGCWRWDAGFTPEGYGKFWLDGRTRLAHRLIYELERGPIPDGLVIDHLCRNRGCVNPEHMEPVTNRANLLRGNTLAAGNLAKTHCRNGHEYNDANTYRPPDGSRMCRVCKRARDRAKYWQLKSG